MLRRFIALALGTSLALAAGCNTMQGLGKDIERGGQALQDKAKR